MEDIEEELEAERKAKTFLYHLHGYKNRKREIIQRMNEKGNRLKVIRTYISRRFTDD